MPKTANPLTKKRGSASINIILTVVVVIVAVGVIGGVLLVNGSKGQSGQPQNGQPVPADVLRKPDSHTISVAPNNRVTLVEFIDFQCPACHSYYQGMMNKIGQDYQGRINFVLRNYPLPVHPLAQQAAKAAEAAGLQGKYTEMYHALEDNYQAWAVAPDGQNVSNDAPKAAAEFDQLARQLGLNVQRFDQDENSQQVTDRINADKADGDKAKVSGTPTIFVNGQQFQPDPSAQSFQQVDQQLRNELNKDLGQ